MGFYFLKFDFFDVFLYNKIIVIIIVIIFMLNKQTLKKNKISALYQEIGLLRSAVIGSIGKDAEGEYRPEFAKKLLRDAREDGVSVFKNKKLFLQSLK